MSIRTERATTLLVPNTRKKRAGLPRLRRSALAHNMTLARWEPRIRSRRALPLVLSPPPLIRWARTSYRMPDILAELKPSVFVSVEDKTTTSSGMAGIFCALAASFGANSTALSSSPIGDV